MKAEETRFSEKPTEHSKVPKFRVVHKTDPGKALHYGYNEAKSQFFYSEENNKLTGPENLCSATELLTIGEQYQLPEEHRGYLLLEIPLPLAA